MRKDRHEADLPHPPDHLSGRSQELWRSIVGRRARSPERLALIRVALEALDRADEARAVVEKEGLTTETPSTGALHIHPLVKVERESRALFVKCWQGLHLDWSPGLDGNGPFQ